jgi:hypothetical protein
LNTDFIATGLEGTIDIFFEDIAGLHYFPDGVDGDSDPAWSILTDINYTYARNPLIELASSGQYQFNPPKDAFKYSVKSRQGTLAESVEYDSGSVIIVSLLQFIQDFPTVEELVSLAQGGGTVAFKPRILDNNGVPIPGVLCSIYRVNEDAEEEEEGETFTSSKETNEDGLIFFGDNEGFLLIPDAAYKFRRIADGYLNPGDEDLTISVSLIQDYYLDNIPFPENTELGKVACFIDVTDLEENITDRYGTITLQGPANIIIDGKLALDREITVEVQNNRFTFYVWPSSTENSTGQDLKYKFTVDGRIYFFTVKDSGGNVFLSDN